MSRREALALGVGFILAAAFWFYVGYRIGYHTCGRKLQDNSSVNCPRVTECEQS